MIRSVLDYLDQAADEAPEKIAFADEERSMTYAELRDEAMRIGSGLARYIRRGQAVPVFSPKTAECIAAFLGVMYAGGYYVPVDVDMPASRSRHILETCRVELLLATKPEVLPKEYISGEYKIFQTKELLELYKKPEKELLDRIRSAQIDTDPMYAIFTSGSTGVPKGVLIQCGAVCNLTEWYCETFHITDEDIFANQTAFYFDASVKEIYSCIKAKATMYIVPKKLFILPAKLMDFLNEHKVTVINWVPSVLCMIVNFHTFRKIRPEYLRTVIFSGEVMPTKQFNEWRRTLPDAVFANLYGPTECTVDAAYYIVDRDFADSESIPIGYPCMNTDVFLLDENDRKVTEPDVQGEICIRGRSLAFGYIGDQEKTDSVFTQNPLCPDYPEKIYRTGDLAKLNQYGEIVFIARKDAQIKHMDHRIELGEIENAVAAVPGIQRACVLYDHKTSRIIAVYEGDIEAAELISALRKTLPAYMLPKQMERMEHLPLNLNGKIDRTALKQIWLKE